MKTKKFYHSLRFKLLASILAGIALITGLASYFFYIEERNQERARFYDFVTDTMDYMEGMMEHEMQVRDMEGIQKSLEGLSRVGGISIAFLLNKKGEIVFSSNKDRIGKSLDIKDASCQVCHRLSPDLMPGRAVFEKGERVLRSVRSITNRPQCYSCHEPGIRTLGLLMVDFPMAGFEKRISFHYKRIIVIILSAILVTGIIGIVLVDQIIIRRLKRVSHATGRLRGEDLQARAEVKGEDEVGELARAFNTMADQLQTSIAQIEGYRQTLEEKLAERIKEFNALYAVSRAATTSLGLEEHLNIVLDKAMEVMDVEAGGIYLLEPDGETMTLKVHRGLSDEFVQGVLKIRLGEGISGKAAQMKMPLSMDIADYPSERLAPIILKEGLQSLASVPLIAEGKALGAITLGTRQSRAFPREKLEVLSLFANHAAISIENYKLYEMQLKKTQELSGLIKAGQAVISSLSLDNVLRSIVFLAAQVMNVSTCVLMLLDEKGEELICQAQIGLPDEWVRDKKHKVGVGLSGLVASEGRPLAVLDIASDPRYVHKDMASKYGFVSYLGVPVKARERLIGVLSILSKRPRPFTEDEIELLSTFADQAAIAIENARLFGDVERGMKELEERVEELERFRRVTIQREFRMKELKDRVKELEMQLERMKNM